MAKISEIRTALAQQLVEESRQINSASDFGRGHLEQIRTKLVALAARQELWHESDYPSPPAEELQCRYQIATEGDNGITLYLNVVKSGKTVPPHNHTTWACIAAVQGVEHNMFYSRTDDGKVAGAATLQLDETLAVGPGDGIAMLADDIHNFEVRGEQIIRHLHFYGRPLESLSERKAFNLADGTYKIMDVGVKTIV